MDSLRLAILSSLIFLSAYSSAQVVGTTLAQAQKTKSAEITIVHDGIEGLSTSNSSLLSDVISDFQKYVREKKGINISSEYVLKKDFNELMSTVKSGKGGVFGLSYISVIPARKADYNFTMTFMNNIHILISSKDIPNLSSLQNISKEFAGKKAYVVKGSTHIKTLEGIKSKYFPNLEIETVESGDAMLDALANDDNAFAAADLIFYISNARGIRQFKRHAAGDSNADQFAIATPKSNDWIALFNEFFLPYRKSASYKEKIAKYLGKASVRMVQF